MHVSRVHFSFSESFLPVKMLLLQILSVLNWLDIYEWIKVNFPLVWVLQVAFVNEKHSFFSQNVETRNYTVSWVKSWVGSS